MAENSKIEWTTHTFNCWRGCTKVSPGCQRCYAETLSGRNPSVLGVWGPNGTRVVAAEAAWREPLKWDRAAEKAGERHRVFCASLADVFEDWRGPMADSAGHALYLDPSRTSQPWAAVYEKVSGCRPLTMHHVRSRLFDLIKRTPHLDWLLLTKRPENFGRLVCEAGIGSEWPLPNVWLGVSVEDQQRADERIPLLLQTPAAVRFLSVEPLLGPVDLRPKAPDAYAILGRFYGTGTFDPTGMSPAADRVLNCFPKIDWCIIGGESGGGARPCDVAWVRSLVQQCRAASVACFVKQLGANRNYHGAALVSMKQRERGGWRDAKGGDPEEWPEDLRVRQFPKAVR
jgi:protein gp37